VVVVTMRVVILVWTVSASRDFQMFLKSVRRGDLRFSIRGVSTADARTFAVAVLTRVERLRFEVAVIVCGVNVVLLKNAVIRCSKCAECKWTVLLWSDYPISREQ
jgi:hypothetical protein